MNNENNTLNFDDFIVIKPKTRDPRKLTLTVSNRGHMSLNTTLAAALNCQDIEVLLAKDLKSVVLIPNGDNSVHFNSNYLCCSVGVTKTILDLFSKSKLSLPVHYHVLWNTKHNVWIGNLVL